METLKNMFRQGQEEAGKEPPVTVQEEFPQGPDEHNDRLSRYAREAVVDEHKLRDPNVKDADELSTAPPTLAEAEARIKTEETKQKAEETKQKAEETMKSVEDTVEKATEVKDTLVTNLMAPLHSIAKTIGLEADDSTTKARDDDDGYTIPTTDTTTSTTTTTSSLIPNAHPTIAPVTSDTTKDHPGDEALRSDSILKEEQRRLVIQPESKELFTPTR